MKKVVRLTESDLVKLIKRVIKEEEELGLSDVLGEFLMGIKNGSFPEIDWVQLSKPTLTGIAYAKDASYYDNDVDVRKPLEWVLYINGQEIDGSFFRIFKSKNGVIEYSFETMTTYNPKGRGKSCQYASTGRTPLNNSTINDALSGFNSLCNRR